MVEEEQWRFCDLTWGIGVIRMRMIDISLPLEEGMTVYPGDGPVKFECLRSREAGDPYNLTYLHLGAHAGTHLDAPLHFLPGGGGVEEVPLREMIGPCRVVSIDESELEIGPSCLEKKLVLPCRRLLLRTRNSSLYRRGCFCREHAYLSPEGASWLKDAGVRLVGMDYFSVEKYGADVADTHLILLEAGICLLEGLDLSEARAGEYLLLTLPLRLIGPEGSPLRAVLMEVPADVLARWE